MISKEEISQLRKSVTRRGRVYKTSPGLDHFLLETAQLERFANHFYEAGAASRDAEVAKWKAIAANKADQVDAAKEVIAEVKEERNQLRAHINKLREALSSAENALDESRDYPVTYDEVITALITTPEQSLAEYRNKVIEAFVNEFSRHVGGDGERRRKNFTRWSTR